jgi:putative phage-type endonuclease
MEEIMSDPVIQAMLERCPKAVLTDTMSYEKWLELRQNSIGGSEAGGLMLLDYNNTPFTIYFQKNGIEKSKEMSRAAKRGKLLEPVMRNWFAEQYPDLLVLKVPYMFYSPKYPFMSANIDGLIEAKKLVIIQGKEIKGVGGLEIKSSKYGYNFSEDEIPDTYFYQVQHYMAVMGLDWFVLSACFLDTEEIRDYVIFRNEESIGKLIAAETKFWEENVVPGVIPAAVGLPCEDDMITSMVTGSTTLELKEDEKELCRKINELKAQIKPLDDQQEALKIDLKAKLEERAKKQPNKNERKIFAVGGPFTVTWSFIESRRLDTDAIKKAGLYDQYSKISTSDRFTVSAKKGGLN